MNFKVKCTKTLHIPYYKNYFTVGKIYSAVDGELKADEGFVYIAWAMPQFGNADFEALCNYFKGFEFELVDGNDSLANGVRLENKASDKRLKQAIVKMNGAQE